jgi:hypothetical protein
MTWWFNNPARLKREIDAIAALATGAADIRLLTWRPLEDFLLAVDVEIARGEEWVPLTVVYPALFPATAPIVRTTDGRRLSSHQYQGNAELCLEIRPDNWQPEFTAAEMLESARRLIVSEAEPEAPPLPTAHAASLGQRSRGERYRFITTPELRSYVQGLSPGTILPAPVSSTILKPTPDTFLFIERIASLGSGAAEWRDPTAPATNVQAGILLRFANGALPSIGDFAALVGWLAACGQDALATRLAASEISSTLVLSNGAATQAYWIFRNGEGQPSLVPAAVIDIPASGARLPQAYDGLRSKRVGLVGCGSLGSKIAGSLARSGVQSFCLVDHDLVEPGNAVRQDYTVEMVGAHKVDALGIRLAAINPSVGIMRRRVLIGGQESATTTASALEDLATCDLIIDASADTTAFNLTSSAVTAREKPMVWGEVLAGGIGGFVARSRPRLDPSPPLVRRAWAAWCEETELRWPPAGTRAYDAVFNGEPMLADDADISVIAAHMVRFAVDILVAPGQSKFPHSLYAVGLAAEWAFSAPFQTIAIPLNGAAGWEASHIINSPDNFRNTIDLLKSVIKIPEAS